MNDTCFPVIEMVRFSCFITNIHHHRSKKEVQQSAETMSKSGEDYSKGAGLKFSGVPMTVAPMISKESRDNPSNGNVEQEARFPLDHWVKPGEMNSDSSPEANVVVHQKIGMKKSQSLGSALDRGGRVSCGDSEDEIEQDLSYDYFDGSNYDRLFDVIDHSAVEEPLGHKDPRTDFINKCDRYLVPESFQGSNGLVPHESIFSIEDRKQPAEGDGDPSLLSPPGYTGDPGHPSPVTLPAIAKSSSLPNFDLLSPTSKDGLPSHAYVMHRCRSSEDLNAINEESEAIQNQVVEFTAMADQERYSDRLEGRRDEYGDPSGERHGNESYEYQIGKDWTSSRIDEVDMIKKYEGESSVNNLNVLPSKDFKIKRIEEWVSMIDLKESSSPLDISESTHSIDKGKKISYVLGSASTAKLDSKSIHGMEMAKNYVSSLPITSTSAQLANLGLIVVPFLSSFVNLKTLNLSGNAIVRITSGALPRGLHVLNLAKNNISSIEGLRELTRLRVLDLSYNRILRIGHGLASCSSLKELYLAGNKISEVDGLHRLLKLNILDLRFNKISTAKCLGQLAANYSSLQAINLEGNPAQRNVGDEQLKKSLQTILPHLVYFNKQPIRASSSKDVVADRSARLPMRSDHKPLVRKGSITSKTASSSIHGHRLQAASSPKLSRDRHGRLPPTGTKGSHRQHYLDLGSKLLGLRSGLSMRRSRSEGNLGASS